MRHFLFLNTKGGVGKSTLCEYSYHELVRLGYAVSVDNTDQQKHVTVVECDGAQFCLYDTAGAFTGANLELLEAASSNEVDAKIIIPMSTGKNDNKEVEFLFDELKKLNLFDKSVVVFTKSRKNSKALAMRREEVKALGMPCLKWVMPQLEDFNLGLHSSKTRNEISAFLHEVAL